MEVCWTPHPRQRDFLQRHEDEVFYGGARGGGKTDALLAWNIIRRQKYAGSRGLFLRRNYNDLVKQGGAIPRSHELLDGVAHWNGTTHTWLFPNGSVLEFGHCKDEASRAKYQGPQYEDVTFEEVTQFTETQFSAIRASARTTRSDVRTRVRAAGNPGGVGHGWVKARFITPNPGGGETITETLPSGLTRTRVFIPSRVYDNPSIVENDPGYLAVLESLPAAIRRAWLDGSWDVFEGQCFAEWDYGRHVITDVEAFAIPEHWPRYRCVDWGYARPFVCLWLAQSPATREVICYREASVKGLRDEEQVALINRLTPAGETISRTVADPSMWAKRLDAAFSARDAYRLGGVVLAKGTNDRLPGKMRVHEFLAVDAMTKRPRLRVFRTCTHLIASLPNLVYSQVDPEDVDTEGDDDAYDALRYGLMALARPPTSPTAGRAIRMGDGAPEPRRGPGADYPSDYMRQTAGTQMNTVRER